MRSEVEVARAGAQVDRREGAVAIAASLAIYAIFWACVAWFVAFLANAGLARTVDRGPLLPPSLAVATDVALVALFGVQHSVMARPWWKRWIARVVPAELERSLYVLGSVAAMAALFALWAPIPAVVWSVDAPWARASVWAVFAAGWVALLVSTLAVDHLDLFGVRQPLVRAGLARPRRSSFAVKGPYRVVRHPVVASTLLVVWVAPVMTAGHLLLALAFTAYSLVGLRFEERGLLREFGDTYRAYQRRVGMILPRVGGRRP